MVKKLRTSIIAIIFIGLLTNAHAQSKVYAIINNQSETFDFKNDHNAQYSKSCTITILNENGAEKGVFHETIGRFMKLKSFSGVIIDSKGKIVKKIKMSDLLSSEYSTSLATDTKNYYYQPTYPFYPYTVKYEHEIAFNDGLIAFPSYSPISNLNVKLETSEYRVIVPSDKKISFKNINTTIAPTQVDDPKEKTTTYVWKTTNLGPFVEEEYSPSYSETAPQVLIVPERFTFEKTNGNMSSWKSYGEWTWNLVKERSTITPAIQAKVNELTKNCTTTEQKISVLYDYLRDNTRYVSIQLGIGGFQPMEPELVHKSMFGDCKALSNYLRILLAAAGIESFYTEISSINRNLFSYFPNTQRSNHAILMVPQERDSLWIECTNAFYPLGYIHQNISGHQAVIVSKDGGKLVRLPEAADKKHRIQDSISVKINPDFSANIEIKSIRKMFESERFLGFDQLGSNDQTDYIRAYIKLNHADISNYKVLYKREKEPSAEIKVLFKTNQYGNKTANRLFSPVNPTKIEFGIPESNTERVNPIKIGFTHNQTIITEFLIPDNIEIESVPKNIMYSNKFGSLVFNIEIGTKKITARTNININRGYYSKDEYNEFVKILQDIDNAYNSVVCLKKKQ